MGRAASEWAGFGAAGWGEARQVRSAAERQRLRQRLLDEARAFELWAQQRHDEMEIAAQCLGGTLVRQ